MEVLGGKAGLTKSVQALRPNVLTSARFAAATSPTLRISVPTAADALARSTGIATILLTGTGQSVLAHGMLFTIERGQPHPRGQKVGAVRRDTARDRLDGIDPRPTTTVDSFDPLVARPHTCEQVRQFTGEGRVALPQFVSKRVTLGGTWRECRTSGRGR